MSYPTKEKREKCWASRDEFFKCLDKKNAEVENTPTECALLKKTFEQLCPDQWVTHFARRRKYLQFKEKMEKGTIDPIDLSDEKDS